MHNPTTVDNTPPFDINWEDATPQKSRGSLQIGEVYPNMEDGWQLFEKGNTLCCKVLVEEFHCLWDLNDLLLHTVIHQLTNPPLYQ